MSHKRQLRHPCHACPVAADNPAHSPLRTTQTHTICTSKRHAYGSACLFIARPQQQRQYPHEPRNHTNTCCSNPTVSVKAKCTCNLLPNHPQISQPHTHTGAHGISQPWNNTPKTLPLPVVNCAPTSSAKNTPHVSVQPATRWLKALHKLLASRCLCPHSAAVHPLNDNWHAWYAASCRSWQLLVSCACSHRALYQQMTPACCAASPAAGAGRRCSKQHLQAKFLAPATC